MTELALTRSSGDKRRYELDGIGTLRLGGLASRWATAEAGLRKWGFARRGILKSVIQATEPDGTVVGEFAGRSLKRGGGLRWEDHEYTLEPDSRWKEHYALVAADRTLATLEGKGWGKRPVRVAIDDDARIDPGLVLFAAFVVRALAEDASAAGTAVVAGS